MGNTLFKDWIEMDSEEEDLNTQNTNQNENATASKQSKTTSTQATRRKLSKNPSNESPRTNDSSVPEASTPTDQNTQTPITNKSKVVIADFDPRSPTSGIVRTPICYLSENNSEAKANGNVAKYSIADPRSPTNEYTRTPIHGITNQAADLNNDYNDQMDDSNSSLETSSLISDSSGVCQQVPENAQAGNAFESPSLFGSKFANSNMPRHILQRKQMEKLNKKKLIDYDKENLKE